MGSGEEQHAGAEQPGGHGGGEQDEECPSERPSPRRGEVDRVAGDPVPGRIDPPAGRRRDTCPPASTARATCPSAPTAEARAAPANPGCRQAVVPRSPFDTAALGSAGRSRPRWLVGRTADLGRMKQPAPETVRGALRARPPRPVARPPSRPGCRPYPPARPATAPGPLRRSPTPAPARTRRAPGRAGRRLPGARRRAPVRRPLRGSRSVGSGRRGLRRPLAAATAAPESGAPWPAPMAPPPPMSSRSRATPAGTIPSGATPARWH